ncbi:MAG: DUF368 domain-containing protein [Anaerolineales bacterium]|nr:DUF368 domain-containing protein [Anaerolineales bacterium]
MRSQAQEKPAMRLHHRALDEHPEYIVALFFGLITASIFIIGKHVSRWSPTNLSVTALAAVSAYPPPGAMLEPRADRLRPDSNSPGSPQTPSTHALR